MTIVKQNLNLFCLITEEDSFQRKIYNNLFIASFSSPALCTSPMKLPTLSGASNKNLFLAKAAREFSEPDRNKRQEPTLEMIELEYLPINGNRFNI